MEKGSNFMSFYFKVLLNLFFWFSFTNPLFAQTKVLEKIEAVVNGEIITLTEISDVKMKLKTGGFLDDLLFGDPEVREKALQDPDYLLKLLIDEKILDFEVKHNGFLVTEERVDSEINTIAKRQNVSENELKRALTQQGVNFSDYRSFVKKSIERRQLVEKEITSKIKISEQDIVSQYLSQSSAGSHQVFEYSLSHILVSSTETEKANEILNKLKSGQPFENLVKEFSVDSSNKESGGTFGKFKTGEMIESIEKSIRPLKIGQYSEIVKTPMGLHIFKVLDKKLIEDPEIKKQEQIIYQKLFAKAFKEQFDFWLIQKRKDAIIQINKS